MNRFYSLLLGLLSLAVALTAPFIVPFALLFTRRNATDLAWSWYDTPDEDGFIGMYEPTVKALYERWGWFVSAWYWFGLRNKAHGFNSLWAHEAPAYWPSDHASHEHDDGFYLSQRQAGRFLIVSGWQVYKSRKFASGLEYRPVTTIKYRPNA